jgi:hypothetical protein
MSGDERAQFLEWHEEQKGKIFCNKQELLAYCMDDINVLMQAFCLFRNSFLNLVKIYPFVRPSVPRPFATRFSEQCFRNQTL